MSEETQPDLDLFDYTLIRNVVGFVFRGIRRHPLMSAGLFVVVTALGLGVVALIPRGYRSDSRLLANQNELIRALGNPRSGIPSEDPTRAAREIVVAHNNLVSLIKQTGLMKNWEETRPLVVKMKDRLVNGLFGTPSEQDQIDAMVGTIEKKLKVDTDRQTVSISIVWPDPQMAYLLVETAQQNFLETRHVTEMTAISEALSILEMHASTVQKSVDDALHQLERVRDERRRGLSVRMISPTVSESSGGQTVVDRPEPDRPSSSAPKPSALSAATEQELAQLKFLINSKRRALQDLDDARLRRVTELTNQLQEQRVQFAEQYPLVLDTKQRLAAAKEDSPQMIALKNDITQLLDEYTRKGGKSPDSLVELPSMTASVSRRPLQAGQAALSGAELADDPMVEFARNNLRVAMAKYEELMMRIDGARIEQDTARAAFKYRYSVVRPASVPKKPETPNVAVLSVVVVMVALFIALLSGSVRDAFSGKFLEAWQIERALNLRVLSEVKTR